MSQTSSVTRRALLSLGLGSGGAPARDAAGGSPGDPFASYETAYAQVNEARPFLAEEARRLGIATENRSELDILKEIYGKAEWPSG